MRSAFLALGAAAALSACSTMSADQCANANWRDIGYRDGAEGDLETAFNSRAKACINAGIAADPSAYLAGRAEGLKQYCTPAGGVRAGAEGKTYHYVCPPEREPEFLGAYRDGRRYYDATADLSRIQSDAYEIDRTINRLDREIDELYRRLQLPNISQADKDAINRQIAQSREERARERGRREGLDRDRWRVQENASRLRGELGARYGWY